jgi:hypothetical protein
LQEIPLRRTSIFSDPGNQSFLPIVIGDWRDTGVPATLIDSINNVYLVSDVPMLDITKVTLLDSSGNPEQVFQNNESFKFFPTYRDSTGRLIAAIESASSLGERGLRVFGRGVTSANSFIENPADIFLWLLGFMGFSIDSIDLTKLEEAKFYFEQKNIDLRYFINERSQLKLIVDQICSDSSSSLVKYGSKSWLQSVIREGF